MFRLKPFLGALLCVLAVAPVWAGQPDNPKFRDLGPLAGKVDHRVIPYLKQLKQKQITPAQAAAALRQEHGGLLSKAGSGETFLVRINCQVDANLLAALKNSGVTVMHVAEQWHTVTATATITQMEALAAIQGIRAIDLEYEPHHRQAGIADNHADIDEKADQVRSLFGVDGTGQKVGILSDTVNRSNAVKAGTTTGTVPNAFLSGTAPQNTGDLSSSIQVVDFGPTSGTDEGEGMLELVHDIAPGAALAFGSAYSDQTTFANNITLLRTAANCTITVDDVGYFAEPMFQDGPIAQAIKGNFQNGVPHFSAAGNDGDTGVMGVYTDINPAVDDKLATPSGNDFHNWGIGGATPTFLPISLPAGTTVYIILQWDQPFSSYGLGAGSQADLDLYLYRDANTGHPLAKSNGPQGVAGAPSGDPVEVLQYSSNHQDTVYLAIDHYDGVRGNRFRLAIETNGINLTFPGVPNSFFNGGTIYGHAATRECIAVGAIFYGDIKDNGTQGPDTTNINAEYYSSKGGIGLKAPQYYFDTSGNALPVPEFRDKPDIAAADGTNTSVFGSDSSYDSDTLPNFYGTSAAAPNCAAVGALLKQRFPGLSPTELLNLMRSGARDIIANDPVSLPGPDDHTGAGLVDALASARTSVWSGGGSDDQFATGPNWVGNTSPAAGNNLLFRGTVRPTPFNNAAGSYGSIQFSTDGFTIGGSALTLTKVQAVTNNTGTNAINVPLTFGNFTVIRVESSSTLNFGSLASIDNGGSAVIFDTPGTCSASGVISGAGSLTMRSGTGTLTLGGANTYSGGTSVTSGTLYVSNTSGSGTGSGAVTLDGRSTLRGNGSISGALSSLSTLPTIWPGTSTGTAQSGETLTALSANLSSGGTLKVRAANSTGGATPQTPVADTLLLTGSGSVFNLGVGSALNLVLNVQDGTYTNQYSTIVNCTGSGTIQSKFTASNITSNHGWPITGISVVYLDSGNNEVDPTATPAKRVALKFSGTITPVTLESFTAKPDGPGVLLAWNVDGELENLGFNLYRRPAGGEETCWANVNAALISGRMTTSEPRQYLFYDWPPEPGEYEYRLETVSLRGARAIAAVSDAVQFEVDNEFPASLEALDGAIHSAQVEARSLQHEKLSALKKLPLIKATVAEISRKDSGIRAVLPREAPIHGEAVKVTCSGRGVLYVPQSALPKGYAANALSVQREGRSVSILSADAKGLLLYAPGYEDDYTDKDVFFLRHAAHATHTVRNAQGLFARTDAPISEVISTAKAQYFDVFYDWNLSPYDYPAWFSEQYLASGTTRRFSISVPHAKADAATIIINSWSLTHGDHSLQAFLNGSYIGEAAWSGGGRALALCFDVPAGILHAGANTIDLRSPDHETPEISLLHSIETTYTRLLEGPEPFEIDIPVGGALCEISKLPRANVWIVDERGGAHAELLPGETQPQPDGTFKARFVSNCGKVIIVPQGNEIAPISVRTRNLKPLQNGLKYLATGPAQFAGEIRPLIAARGHEGLNGAFVDQEDLFDWYGFGRYGPEPIRSAVRQAMPRFFLLVGRTTYDYRDRTPPYVDPLCPTFLTSTTYFWLTSSDSHFADLGGGYPEIAVGRLPANNPTELAAMVQQTLNYGGAPYSGESALIVADQAEPDGDNFAAQADSIVNSAPDISWNKAYLGVNYATAPEITQVLQNASHSNVDLIVYVGHGNARTWSDGTPEILTVDDVKTWTGSVMLLAATCNGNWFVKDVPGYHNIAIQGMCQPQGGIVGSISTNTYMESAVDVEFMQVLLRSAASEDCRWGEVLLKAQQWAHNRSFGAFLGSWFEDLSRTESLLGDPALRVYRHPPKH